MEEAEKIKTRTRGGGGWGKRSRHKKKGTCLGGASRDVTLETRTPQSERTRVQAMRIGTAA